MSMQRRMGLLRHLIDYVGPQVAINVETDVHIVYARVNFYFKAAFSIIR